MPIANLQSYHSLSLRVKSTAFAAQGQAMSLEASVLEKLQKTCGFDHVARAGSPADVVLDLNITQSGRGGGGLISNSSKANIETLLVMSDGQSGELLGTARIHGESSGMIINNAPPENEALDVIAKSVADLMAKSGCTGPRIAKAEPPPPVDTPPPNTGSGTAAPDESKRPAAEKLNEDGKEKLRNADVNGALALFQQANTTLPDPRYQFNVCLALEAGDQWDNATAACQKAKAMNPDARLAAKIDHHLDLLAHHQ